jgi:catechol 2,3-dioxygenase-like lactoylglutathione lyase family enzyme
MQTQDTTREPSLIATCDPTATIAVKNLDAAKKFYEGVLGLSRVQSDGDEAVTYRCGRSQLLVYRSRYAGTNQATAVCWMVDDIAKAVRQLKAAGVTFEQYDLPQGTREGEIHVMGEMKAAWFKDPDGNILSLSSRTNEKVS